MNPEVGRWALSARGGGWTGVRRTRVNGEQGKNRRARWKWGSPLMRTPDGGSRLELTTYHAPAAVNVPGPGGSPPANTPAQNHVRRNDIDPRPPSARPRSEVLREVAQVSTCSGCVICAALKRGDHHCAWLSRAAR